jgi:hypothetical protein
LKSRRRRNRRRWTPKIVRSRSVWMPRKPKSNASRPRRKKLPKLPKKIRKKK